MKPHNEITFTFEDYYASLHLPTSHISREEFHEKTNLRARFSKFDESDVRYVHFDGDTNAFVDFFYDFLVVRHRDFLRTFFEKRIAPKKIAYFDDVPLVDIIDNTLPYTPSFVSFIRSAFNEEMMDCTQGRTGKQTMSQIFTEILCNGHIETNFFIPSTFVPIVEEYPNIPEALIVTMRTVASTMSVLSPRVYRTLFCHMIDESFTRKRVLIPSASWGSPGIALYGENVDYDVVDIQASVIDKCNDMFGEEGRRFVHGNSERLTEYLDGEYDICLFCPPYYDLEIYPGEEQSTTTYDTYDAWLAGYWRNTVREAHTLMRTGGKFAFVMSNCLEGTMIGDDMMHVAEEFFRLDHVIKIVPVKNSSALEYDDRYENCYIMIREESTC